MFSSSALLLVSVLASFAAASPLERRQTAIQRQTYVPAGESPLQTSVNYIGANNGTLKNSAYVAGKSFDRIIQIWLENTDYADAATLSQFQTLQEQGLLLDSYYGVTHPSEPNYMASVFGDFFGLGDDNYYYVPENITSMFDVLDDGKISWACYQENLPTDGYQAFNYTQKNYVDPAVSANYTYYVRKHNPCALSKTSGINPSWQQRNRNFNDFVADLNASAIPQWNFVTPNLVNDAHDTGVAYAANWTQWWLTPLLQDERFNTNRTIILLTFDENESYSDENRIYTLVLGNGLPEELRNTTDSTYYTHYSIASTVQNNWGLKNLGRGDVMKGMNNVFSWVANVTGFANQDVPQGSRPQTNLTGVFNGPLNPEQYVNFVAPNSTTVIGAGNQSVLILSGLNTSLTAATAPGPVNLTAINQKSPYDNATSEFASSAATKEGSANSASAALPSQIALVTSLLVAGTCAALL